MILPQPKSGDGVVFCDHLIEDGVPMVRGGYVIRILPGQPLAPDELPHEWLVVCRACKAEKDADPRAPIAGLRYDWPEGLLFNYTGGALAALARLRPPAASSPPTPPPGPRRSAARPRRRPRRG